MCHVRPRTKLQHLQRTVYMRKCLTNPKQLEEVLGAYLVGRGGGGYMLQKNCYSKCGGLEALKGRDSSI